MLISAAWILGYTLTRPIDKPVPKQAVTLPETNIPAPAKSIEGLSNLTRDGLSHRQTLEIEASLKEFLTTLNTTKLVVDVSSSSRVFDSVNSYYIYRFFLLADTEKYSVDVLYISSSDALIRVFNTSGVLVYTPASDEH